jgi:hypothetical protein
MNPFSLDHIFPLARGSTLRQASPRARASSFRCHMDRLSASSFHPSLCCQRPSGRGHFCLPARAPHSRRRTLATAHTPFVGLVRVELTTSRLSGVRSNHLSYRPKYWRVTASNHVSHQKAAHGGARLADIPYTEKGGELRQRALMRPSPKRQAALLERR